MIFSLSLLILGNLMIPAFAGLGCRDREVEDVDLNKSKSDDVDEYPHLEMQSLGSLRRRECDDLATSLDKVRILDTLRSAPMKSILGKLYYFCDFLKISDQG